jgi:glycosyltransferase involved in cell wall biosynthesis
VINKGNVSGHSTLMSIYNIEDTLDPDLVTVIVPVYNSANYLPRCVDSILNQGYQEIEVILINDGSTDRSGEICDTYARDDFRVRAVHTQNRGVSSARNTGLKNSMGSFIFFVDSDDFIEENAVSALMQGYKHSQADLVVGAFNKINVGSTVSQIRDFSSDQLLTKESLVEYTIAYLQNPRQHQLLMSSWAKLFRSKIIRDRQVKFREELRIAEDVAFNFDYLNSAESVFFVNEVIYNHQKLGTYDSLSMRLVETEPKSLFGYLMALESVSNFLRLANSEIEIAKAIGHCYVYQVALFMVRLCGQINRSNIYAIYKLVNELVSDLDFRTYVKGYIPADGNYRLIPFLMRLKFVWLVMGVSWYEAYKLYGTGGNGK